MFGFAHIHSVPLSISLYNPQILSTGVGWVDEKDIYFIVPEVRRTCRAYIVLRCGGVSEAQYTGRVEL